MDTAERPTPTGGKPNRATLVLLAIVAVGGATMIIWSNVVQNHFGSAAPLEEGRDDPSDESSAAQFAAERRLMVEQQLRSRDIDDRRVLEVMGRVARERFMPQGGRKHAYEDRPVPIGLGQTISQPYIVALMTQLARPKPTDRALDVGVGSGYQTAVLAELCQHVYGIEILEPLATAATRRLDELGYKNVTVRCGDGSQGWAEHAPFDIILVAAAPERVPQPLLDQLAPGGRLIIPVGEYYQDLLLIEKRLDGTFRHKNVIPVRFVPMTGGTSGTKE
jgi:protein-L-isoaspartate(D-aspartate) O-methyltransferase